MVSEETAHAFESYFLLEEMIISYVNEKGDICNAH